MVGWLVGCKEKIMRGCFFAFALALGWMLDGQGVTFG